jgi:hypothetical protein
VIIVQQVSLTLSIYLLLVYTAPTINEYPGQDVIAGVVDTAEKLINGDNDTSAL